MSSKSLIIRDKLGRTLLIKRHPGPAGVRSGELFLANRLSSVIVNYNTKSPLANLHWCQGQNNEINHSQCSKRRNWPAVLAMFIVAFVAGQARSNSEASTFSRLANKVEVTAVTAKAKASTEIKATTR